MRTNWFRRFTILGSLGILALTSGQASANGWGLFERNYIVTPSAYYEVVPSAYVLPTTYVVPTSYVAPTTYAIAPTVYVGTTYVVPTTYYTRRPVYATYAYPTTYVYATPTVYEAPMAADACCVTVPAAAAPKVAPRSSAAPAAAKSTPSTVVSEPAMEPSANANPQPEPEPATTKRDTAPPQKPLASSAVDADAAEVSPPAAPAPDKSNEATAPTGGTPLSPNVPNPSPLLTPAPAPVLPANPAEASPPAGASGSPVKLNPPRAPVDESPALPLPEDPAATKRESQKPVFDATRAPYRRSGRSLNVLEGKVLSIDTGRPEEGVRLTLSSKNLTVADKEAVTDAFGHYAVRLPDGDWTVKVTSASGKLFPVSTLVVSGGQIQDDLGRDIPSLTITR